MFSSTINFLKKSYSSLKKYNFYKKNCCIDNMIVILKGTHKQLGEAVIYGDIYIAKTYLLH